MSKYKLKACEFCTYRWIPKVDSPKSCPRCKRRFDYKDAKLVLEILGREYGYDLLGDME
ncbi:hypothetical protein HY637_02670 [Candidatus Woesearchaeota archaeon]|nr:hypothetical protein [Candidatus Woesearchaeota archaeon]